MTRKKLRAARRKATKHRATPLEHGSGCKVPAVRRRPHDRGPDRLHPQPRVRTRSPRSPPRRHQPRAPTPDRRGGHRGIAPAGRRSQPDLPVRHPRRTAGRGGGGVRARHRSERSPSRSSPSTRSSPPASGARSRSNRACACSSRAPASRSGSHRSRTAVLTVPLAERIGERARLRSRPSRRRSTPRRCATSPRRSKSSRARRWKPRA